MTIELTKNQALVFYDWLVRFNARDEGGFADQAEQRLLWDLETALEKQLSAPLATDYQAMLATARDAVRDIEE